MEDEDDTKCLVLVDSNLNLLDKHILDEDCVSECMCVIDDSHAALA